MWAFGQKYWLQASYYPGKSGASSKMKGDGRGKEGINGCCEDEAKKTSIKVCPVNSAEKSWPPISALLRPLNIGQPRPIFPSGSRSRPTTLCTAHTRSYDDTNCTLEATFSRSGAQTERSWTSSNKVSAQEEQLIFKQGWTRDLGTWDSDNSSHPAKDKALRRE
jgi:hypothetical protein